MCMIMIGSLHRDCMRTVRITYHGVNNPESCRPPQLLAVPNPVPAFSRLREPG